MRYRIPTSRRCLVVALALGIIACERDSEPTYVPGLGPPGPPAHLSITPRELGLVVGYREQIVAIAFDSIGRTTPATLSWSSANPSIASVDQSGAVTAISAGRTTVIVGVNGVSATVAVTVIAVSGSIAFSRQSCGLGDCYLLSEPLIVSIADRTVLPVLDRGPFESVAGAAWSPDGAWVAVEVIDMDASLARPQEAAVYASDIYLVRPRGSGDGSGTSWRRLTSNGRSRSASWSPDGTRIAYVGPGSNGTRNQIYTLNVASGESVRLTSLEGWYDTPRWSPDGTRLAFSYARAPDSFDDDIFIVNADGTALTNVTRHDAADVQPDWSPDGTRLAFISDRKSTGTLGERADVFVTDVDGRNVRNLTGGLTGYVFASSPAWSPDGRGLAFSMSVGSGARIYGMVEGSLPVQLTTPPTSRTWDALPVWRR